MVCGIAEFYLVLWDFLVKSFLSLRSAELVCIWNCFSENSQGFSPNSVFRPKEGIDGLEIIALKTDWEGVTGDDDSATSSWRVITCNINDILFLVLITKFSSECFGLIDFLFGAVLVHSKMTKNYLALLNTSCPHTHTAPPLPTSHMGLEHLFMFNEPTLAYHHHSGSTVYVRVHSWYRTVHEFSKM